MTKITIGVKIETHIQINLKSLLATNYFTKVLR